MVFLLLALFIGCNEQNNAQGTPGNVTSSVTPPIGDTLSPIPTERESSAPTPEATKISKNNKKEPDKVEKIRVQHILVATKEDAEKILARLKKGEDFAVLAVEYSTCPSKKNGGDLGLFGRNEMVKPFEEAAFALKVGEVSKPVETEFGWHLIKRIDPDEKLNVPKAETIQASHILVDKKEEADEIYKEIKKGADFGKLAKEKSKCPSKANGGDLGEFTRGMMVKPFEDAAFALKVGEVSEPVKTQFGWHIIKRTK